MDGPGPAFDAHHPPGKALVDDCVHCGFCLPACPTYVLWGEEMDSPRGRILLMDVGLAGEPLSPDMVRHFDQCLGCMACVTACPSGVRYDRLIEATRQQVERRHPRSARERAFAALVFALFPHPRRLRWLRGPLALYGGAVRPLLRRAGVLDRLPPRLRALERLLPESRPAEPVPARLPAATPAPRARVGLLTGCVQQALFSHVNAATARVLAAEGCEVVAPPQGCCGALSVHSGREAEGQALARRLIDAFDGGEGLDAVVVNAAGCGSNLKEYGHLLRDDPDYAERAAAFAAKARDLSELLEELGPVAERRPLPLRVAYHDACHLAHAQGIRSQPRAQLGRIPGLEVRELAEPELCCGSAGVYNLLQPEPAAELGARKAAAVADSDAELLVTCNPGCLLQLGAGLAERGTPLPAVHLAEVVDAAIRGADPAVLTRRPARRRPGPAPAPPRRSGGPAP